MTTQSSRNNALIGNSNRTISTRPEQQKQSNQIPLTGPVTGIPLYTPVQDTASITKLERDQILTETAVKQSELPLLVVTKSAISLFSWEDMEKIAPVRVTNTNKEGDGSVNDPRMGSVSLSVSCQYCSQIDCPGHYGLIEFRKPIYNPAFIRDAVSILTCVCNDCGSLLVTEDLIIQKGLNKLSYDKKLSKLEELCSGQQCLRRHPHIGVGSIVACAKNPVFVTSEIKDKGEITYKRPSGDGKESIKGAAIEHMPIDTAITILDRISSKDAYLLGFPSYHYQFPIDVVLRFLDRASSDLLTKYHLEGNFTTRQRPYKVILDILGNLTIDSLTQLGFTGFHREYPPETLLEILKRSPQQILVKYQLIDYRDMAYSELMDHLDMITANIFMDLGFVLPYKQISNEEVYSILDNAGEDLLYAFRLGGYFNHRQLKYEEIMGTLDMLDESSIKLLGFTEGSHPRNVIMRGILVPPIIARPPIYEGGNTYYDQLTDMFMTIMGKVINMTGSKAKSGAANDLYTTVKQLIFQTEGKKIGNVEFLSIIKRIQGKEALLRGLLMGKRGDYCARTVAGPDPSVKFGEIRLPRVWARTLTKKIRVTRFNIKSLTELLNSGRITHIIPKVTGLRKFYKLPNDPNKRYTLQIGDIVERWLQDGDRVVVNRQPTLHRQSMMSYRVVLGHQLNIGLHLSYTSPMNCDFDGDENNVLDPQDFEVESELEILLNVKNNIMSTEQNRNIMGLPMNGTSGAYLMTNPDTRIDDDLFSELLTFITNTEALLTLYQRLIKYGVHPRSGAAIFSAMLPEDFYYNYKGVIIMEGILVSGQLRKSHVGASHRSIIQDLHKKYGPERTSHFFTEAPWIINKWLIERGFSVGISDMINYVTDPKSGNEYDRNQRILDEELAKIYVKLEALGGPLSDPTEEDFRQRKINNYVNIAQGIGLRLAKEVLSGDNSIGIMTDQGAGTKGGLANIGQMMGSVGQQFYHGKRLKPTITGGRRLLPTFDVDDNNPVAHAFIPDSFFKGLSPEGLFFLQAGGREGLLDTALKTAETGSMSHRMIKAFENIVIGYDGSIRNTIGTLFSPMYNSGYDIGELMFVEYPGKSDFSSFCDIKNIASELNIKRGFIPKTVDEVLTKRRNELVTSLENKPDDILSMPSPNYVKGPILPNTAVDHDITEPVQRQPATVRITKYEKSRIISARAMQLSNDDRPFIDQGTETDPVAIAMMEYDEGILGDREKGIYIVRKFADGSYQKAYPTLDNIYTRQLPETLSNS